MSAPRILIVGPAWVGDMVMAHSLIQTLLQRHSGAVIDVLAPRWSLPLLARMPGVHEGIEMPLGHGQIGLATRWRLGRRLRGRYTQAIILPGSLKSAIVPFFAGIPQRTGFRGEYRYGLINDMRSLDKARLPMTVQRFTALGLPAHAVMPPPYPRPRLTVDPANQARLLRELALDTSLPVIAMMPGAEYGPAKQWPLSHFAALARHLVASGRQVWILGSAKDRAAGETISSQAGAGVLNLCGQTRLEDAVDLLALAQAAVTNDSGLMHVAAALDVPTIALFGSSSPAHTPPLSARAKVLYLGLGCSPCFKRVCPLGHTRCLFEIHPSQVMEAIQDL
ncbi:MAG: lipopolysaccharide heptosyltransferase II [Gammaproteobacteria bacterium]|nr:lipopolysaccharide heptosyltransferase II [Gammaproteobacteria bacterium]